MAADEQQLTLSTLFTSRYTVLVCRFVLAGTFFVSSLGKMVDIEHYSVAMVYNFEILPRPLALGFGWALPFIELSCALGLLLGVLTRLSSLGIALLSASFLMAKVIVLSRGVDIECGCFGAVATTMASWSIYLDPIVLILTLAVLLSPGPSRHWVSLGSKLPETWKRTLRRVW